MSKRTPFTKLSVFLVLCSIGLFSFAHLGALAYDRFLSPAQPVSGSENKDVAGPSDQNPEHKSKSEATIETISEIKVDGLPLTPGLQQFIDTNPEIEIRGASPFSLLEFIEGEGFTGATDQDLSTLASYLYELILPTNFEVIERNQSRELPDGTELGMEAYVNEEQGKDFIFSNPNSGSYTITLQWQGDLLSISLKGAELPYRVTVERRDKLVFKPKVIKQYSPYLHTGEVMVTKEGRNGMQVEVWRSFQTMKGEFLKEEKVSEDFYLPVHKEELHSMKDYVAGKAVDVSEVDETSSEVEEHKTRDSSVPQESPSNQEKDEQSDSPDNANSPSTKQNSNASSSEEDLPLPDMK
ncbi:hypothetical protein [Rossellomorea sp. y25]|uniref:hypothetical protein n=1 Tax=Rossellomorea sp. y25 TaxID=3118174 RepID=UPI0030DFA7BF